MKIYVPDIIYNILEALKSTYRNLLGYAPLHLCFSVIKRVNNKKHLMNNSMGHATKEIIHDHLEEFGSHPILKNHHEKSVVQSESSPLN